MAWTPVAQGSLGRGGVLEVEYTTVFTDPVIGDQEQPNVARSASSTTVRARRAPAPRWFSARTIAASGTEAGCTRAAASMTGNVVTAKTKTIAAE
jgi:hypothetical protein